MNVAVLGTLASGGEAPDDLQKVLEDQVFDSHMTDMNDQLLKEVFGG